ncbi:PrgI family protein [Spongiactinospora rosea]|uniref:PrgI family protein n=1 Tax=Spongiactinospora rosea TaxID=2248750 RepID=A0A366LX26_9ACTN|nr:PrgI family protein [Spongiactinospora rosea]RBQ18110.1 PrgI family protein [Spongiactinospora rosea]
MNDIVRIPADVEAPDKIIGGFTARQIIIFGGTGVLLYGGYLLLADHVPPLALAVFAVPIAVAGIVLAIGRHDGISLDRYVLAALRHRRAAKHMTRSAAPAPPTWIAARPGPSPSPLRLPARGVTEHGLIDLGPDGVAAVAEVSTVNFALRTAEEQDALVSAFARWLNALSGQVQVLVRAERIDLSAAIADLRNSAPALPHPALSHAAAEHAAFLTDLSARHDLLRRQVLLIVREPAAGPHGSTALRRLDEAARVLSAGGLVVRPLPATAVHALLTSCFDPTAPPLPDGDDVIGGSR